MTLPLIFFFIGALGAGSMYGSRYYHVIEPTWKGISIFALKILARMIAGGLCTFYAGVSFTALQWQDPGTTLIAVLGTFSFLFIYFLLIYD